MSVNQIITKSIELISGLRVKPKKHLRTFIKYNSVKKLRNFLNIILEFRQRRVTLSAFPFILNVDPTNVCNLRCPLCPTGAGEVGRPPGKMGLSEFKNIIDEVGDYLYEVNLYRFGEPLLNKEVFSMARLAYERHIFTSVSTNLNILGEDDAEALVQSKLDHLIVSIDGLTSETYTRYRVGGDFDRVIANLKKVVEWKRRLKSQTPFIEWQFLVFKHNQHEVPKVEQFARALGANGVYIRNADLSTDYRKDDANSSEWVLVEEERSKYPEEKMGNGKACDFLWYTLTINHDGGVSPCCMAYNKGDDFGNFFAENSSLHEIWNNAKFRAARSIFREKRLPPVQDILCNSCFVTREFLQTKQEKNS